MSSPSQPQASCSGDHCITCADEGVPMLVVRVDEAAGLALCENARGARSTVETALLPPLSPGDRVLVHAGTAIAALSAEVPA